MRQAYGKDKYKRILAEVILPDGMNVNQECVKDGWYWWCWKYAPTDDPHDFHFSA